MELELEPKVDYRTGIRTKSGLQNWNQNQKWPIELELEPKVDYGTGMRTKVANVTGMRTKEANVTGIRTKVDDGTGISRTKSGTSR